MKVGDFAALENPPPSDHEEHLSAWHMPEMKRAHFKTCHAKMTCRWERHYKPQMVGGTLQGIEKFNKPCNCKGRPHEPVIGKEKSSRSSAYPKEFCQAYGELAAKHFFNVAKAEFLDGRLRQTHKVPQEVCK